MAASYPTSIKSNFAAKAHGHVIYASHLTDIEDEVVAIETALKTGPTVLAAASFSGAVTLAGGLNTPLVVAQGGTGLAAAGTSGNVLTSTGSAWASSAVAAGAAGLEQTFRGLNLRTDTGVALGLTTVVINGLTQWVTDDGTLVDEATAISNPTALITGAGAGGLDTGAEAASTWYEIYRIRKSSDGTLNTMFHRAKDYFLDESFLTNTGSLTLRGGTSGTKRGQSFDTDVTGLVEFADVYISREASPTGSMWAELYATSGGLPTGSVLATSDSHDVSVLSTTLAWIRFPFRTPVSLTAGTMYALVLAGDFAISATNFARWGRDSAAGYGAGTRLNFDGSTWTSEAQDLNFKIYVTQNDTALTYPTGYDQKCLIGYAYNDSSSHLVGFIAKDRNVRRMVRGAATVSATIATLHDVSAYVPPVQVSVDYKVYNGTASDFMMSPRGHRAPDNDGYVAGGSLTTLGAANDMNETGPMHLDFHQGVYVGTTAGTATYDIIRWEW
jgi:hypothetical protein